MNRSNQTKALSVTRVTTGVRDGRCCFFFLAVKQAVFASEPFEITIPKLQLIRLTADARVEGTAFFSMEQTVLTS